MKFLIKALRGLAKNPIKRSTAFKTGAAIVATGATGPILKYTAPGEKQAFNRGYSAWVMEHKIVSKGEWASRKKKIVRQQELNRPSGRSDLPTLRRAAKESRKQNWRNATGKGNAPYRGVGNWGQKRTPWSSVAKARAARAQDLRRIRELKQLGKKPSELTRRSFLTPKKGTR